LDNRQNFDKIQASLGRDFVVSPWGRSGGTTPFDQLHASGESFPKGFFVWKNMKHYPHHIGDFDRATRHLTRIERSIYRDLLDLYYDTEQSLTLDRETLCRRIVARTNEESTAVEQVLKEFFTETPTGWYHVRCEAEIEAYRSNTSQKAMAGKASAEAKRLKKLQALNGNSTSVEHTLKSAATNGNGTLTNQSTNQPITNQPITNQPITKKEKKGASANVIQRPESVSEQIWNDWLVIRKKKDAPLTETAWSLMTSQAAKAGWPIEKAIEECCLRNWQSFKADWVVDKQNKPNGTPKVYHDISQMDYTKGVSHDGSF
jgi:uncharacterized protein YdaU (DUF1376 family)